MNRTRNVSFWSAALIATVLLAIAAPASFAQAAQPAAQGTTATAAPASAPVTKTKPPFKEEELASLLAPIALYPDSVVTQILMASTYPLEVVEANRWVQQKKSMKPDELAKAAEKQPWDASVQGLCAIPDVLKMMDEKLDWTQKVGDAFLAQQKEVMAMIQTLRAKAKEAGNLKSDDKMKVTTEAAPADSASKTEVIVIESADPQVIYVPTYSPTTIYGYWGYPAYPPYYWPPPVGYPGSGFWWGVGIGISIGYWGGHYNHCYPDWHGGDINIGEINVDRGDRNQINAGDRNRVNTGDRGASAKATDRSGGGSQKWSHNPDHRKGVSYRDNATASKFDRSGSGAGASSRDAYRGRSSGGGIQTSSEWRSGGGSGASAGTRDVGGSSGTRNLSGGSGASAGTRDLGAGGGNVGSSGKTKTLGSTPAGSGGSSARSGGSSYSGGTRGGGSSSSAFGGMNSGARASSYSSRGGMSRGGGGGRRR